MPTLEQARYTGRDITRVLVVSTLLGYVLLSVSLSAQTFLSSIRTDEDLIFFPGVAVEERVNSWTTYFHGWIFERERDWGKLGLFKKFLGDRFGLQETDFTASRHFRDRAQMFLVDNERDKRISVSYLGSAITLAKSTEDGHIRDRLTRSDGKPHPSAWTTFQVLTRSGDPRVIVGASQLISASGVSVISDIDDTVKDSNVLNRYELAANTFLRDFRAVPGMAELYRRWAASGDAVFHYVSGSPWQLYPALSDFLRRDGFPAGSFVLRPFRWKDRTALELLIEERAFDFKVAAIERLMTLFPQRRFVFVGDSAERDPDVYSHLASRFPAQVSAILIRDVRGETLASPRFVKLYEHLAPHIQRRVFRHANELADVTFRGELR